MIDLKRTPRSTGASDEHCIWDLIVNGYTIGTYYGGKQKKYLNKYKWAEEQTNKRNPVLDRNILRLKKELELLEAEKRAINETLD